MLEQWAVWGAIILGGSSVVAWIKFWMDQGAVRIQARSAIESAALAHANLSFHVNKYNEDRVRDSREYVTLNQLNAAEKRLTDTVESLRTDIRGVGTRMDTYFSKQNNAGS